MTTFSFTGAPRDCIVAFEQFLQEIAPDKPRRNHMVMIAEHSIHGFQMDKYSVHQLNVEIDVEGGVFNFKLVKV